ncbi:MAG: hypothetical protein ACKO2C_01720 [Actinomycetes bacterium]
MSHSGLNQAQYKECGVANPGTNDPTQETIVDILEHQRSRALGDIFPMIRIRSGEAIPVHQMDTRTRNVLLRAKCFTWGDLAPRSVEEINAWVNAGIKTVKTIVLASARRAEEIATMQTEGAPQGPTLEQLLADLPDEEPMTTVDSWLDFNRDFERVLRWSSTQRGAQRLGDVFAFILDHDAVPADIRSACAAWLNQPIYSNDCSELASAFVDALGEHRDVFTLRTVVLGSRPTLEELGLTKGVTRERIRQIESKLTERAGDLIDSDEFAVLRWRAAEAHILLGRATLVGSARLDHARSLLTEGIDDPAGTTVWELLLWLAGGFSVDTGWLVAPGSRLTAIVEDINDALAGESIVTAHQIQDAAAAVGMHRSNLDEICTLLPSWRPIGSDFFLRWDGTVGDKIERIFNLVNSQLTPQQINTHLGLGRTDGYIKNVLAQDERFIRLGKGKRLAYALAKWGWEEYSGVANEIMQRIERGGGSASLAEMVEEFTVEFGVQASSVRTFAATPAFVIEGDRVRLRRPNEPFAFERRIGSTPGLFTAPDGSVIFHVPVDGNVLRGSGSSLPPAAASRLGIEPGGSAEFIDESTGNRIPIAWSMTAVQGPTHGSLRPFAEGLGAVEGDTLRLVMDPGSLRCRAELQTTTDLEGFVGIPIAGDPIEAIATAMEVDVASVRSRLADRGEHALLALLPKPTGSAALAESISHMQLLD